MCDWRAGGGPLKLNMDLGLTLQSIGLFPASYQIHVLCPNIRIWLWPPMDFVFVCNESLSGDLVEGFFSSGVKERLRLLVQAALRKGCGLQECGCWTRFLQIYRKDLQSDITVVMAVVTPRYRAHMVIKSSRPKGGEEAYSDAYLLGKDQGLDQIDRFWATMKIFLSSSNKNASQLKKQLPLLFASQHFINLVCVFTHFFDKVIATSPKFKIKLAGSLASPAVSSLISTAVSCLKYSCTDAELLSLDGPHHVQHLFLMSCAFLCARNALMASVASLPCSAMSRHTLLHSATINIWDYDSDPVAWTELLNTSANPYT